MLRLFSFAAGLAVMATQAAAQTPQDDLAGRVVASHDGGQIELPLLNSDYAITIEGDMATVAVTQTFANPSDVPLNAQYLFPLNQDAAVFGMEMRLGDEVIQAVIQEKAEAQATFDTARDQGQAAALLTQHRPNMFTQDIANLMPGQQIEVQLRYVQMVPKIEGRYELIVPLIVGPRYEGAADAPMADPFRPSDEATGQSSAPPADPGHWQVGPLPSYPPVAGLTLPDSFTAERVSLSVEMAPGLPLQSFGSDTHALDVDQDDTHLSARFAQGRVLDNRDLVLHYRLGGEDVAAAALTHQDARGDFVSLMIEPPRLPEPSQIAARELVFVLDTSGSMSGQPMAASKRFMRAALSGLRPGDYFRVIPFANQARHMSERALPATPRNIAAGQRFVNGLHAGGGTEIESAIRAAFATAQPPQTMRIVVFLSDGYIGQEAAVLRTIRDQIGSARIYAFGVGSSVNRYLLDSMAEEGRGYARYVGVDEDSNEVAETLARDLKSPLLTDISIDWGAWQDATISPARVPDLFGGGAVRVYARHDRPLPETVTLHGQVQGRPASIVVPVTASTTTDNPALPLIWARNRIADLERNVAVGEQAIASDRAITELGLDFSLQTKNTSFVAVSTNVVNQSGQEAADAQIALPQVHGVSANAYPSAFSGASTPEPAAIFGMILLALLSWLGFRHYGYTS